MISYESLSPDATTLVGLRFSVTAEQLVLENLGDPKSLVLIGQLAGSDVFETLASERFDSAPVRHWDIEDVLYSSGMTTIDSCTQLFLDTTKVNDFAEGLPFFTGVAQGVEENEPRLQKEYEETQQKYLSSRQPNAFGLGSPAFRERQRKIELERTQRIKHALDNMAARRNKRTL